LAIEVALAKNFNDPLLWWKARKLHYPILSGVEHIMYLCIPVRSEAPSEHVIPSFEQIQTMDGPELAGRMVFIKKNLEGCVEFFKQAIGEDGNAVELRGYN
jgi:hypothetical protein